MKKILFSLLFVGVCSVIHAAPVSILPSTVISHNGQVTCSSTTATIVLGAESTRKGMAIKNKGSYTVRISTFATTNNAIGYPVAVGEEFADNIEPYSGNWYVISIGPNVNIVDVIEKLGVNN